jgi:K+-sensing histidine kinase KdpD
MQAAVRRLTRTVNLLLETTRLEEGQLQLQREWC